LPAKGSRTSCLGDRFTHMRPRVQGGTDGDGNLHKRLPVNGAALDHTTLEIVPASRVWDSNNRDGSPECTAGGHERSSLLV